MYANSRTEIKEHIRLNLSLAKLLQRLLCGLWRKLELVMDSRNDCSLSGCSAYWFYLHIFLQALFGIFRIRVVSSDTWSLLSSRGNARTKKSICGGTPWNLKSIPHPAIMWFPISSAGGYRTSADWFFTRCLFPLDQEREQFFSKIVGDLISGFWVLCYWLF